jgi:hypothetical protein
VHLIRCRRREHLTGAGGVEHADADEAAVERLVSEPPPEMRPTLPATGESAR